MKILLIFTAILVINMSFIVYQGDMNKYMQAQTYLKITAEECAAGAALYFDEEYFSQGKMVFNYDEGEKYIKYLIEQEESRMPFPKGSKMTYSLGFEDDLQGFEKEPIPAVTVRLKVETEDLFRLPFLTVTSVERGTKYELPEA